MPSTYVLTIRGLRFMKHILMVKLLLGCFAGHGITWGWVTRALLEYLFYVSSSFCGQQMDKIPTEHPKR